MPTVDSIAEAIIAREGGFVNDPDDPGGATNFGVTTGRPLYVGGIWSASKAKVAM